MALRAAALTLCAAASVRALAPVGPRGVDEALDCGVRALALEYAQYLQPSADTSLVFDALRLGSECNQTFTPSPQLRRASAPRPRASAFYVDAVKGSDSNSGTQASPFRTIARGLVATRGAGGGSQQLVLRDSGPFFLGAPVSLGPEDTGLEISAFPGEAPVLSGGAPISGLTWTFVRSGPAGGLSGPFSGVSVVSDVNGLTPGGNVSGVVQYGGSFDAVAGCAAACTATSVCGSYTWHDSTCGQWALGCYFRIDGSYGPQGGYPGHFTGQKVAGVNASVWSAPLPASLGLTLPFDNLYAAATGRRVTRAKAPNGNPELTIDGFAGGARAWLPPQAYPPPQDIHIASPSRPDDPFFPTYQFGVGGTCAIFEPPQGFWCSTNPPAGSEFNVPSGVSLPPGLLPGDWNDTTAAVFHAFHGDRWGDWKFKVTAADAASGSLNWTYGGFQEARGWSVGDTFMLEGMLELLDDYDEWFLDARAALPQPLLYVMVNASAPPPGPSLGFIASQIDSLVRIEGATNVTLSGLTLSHTAPTFMKPFAMASGGDWSVRRDAALLVNASTGVTVSGCAFNGIGGNAVLITGRSRATTVAGSSFRFVGDSAIVSLGEFDGIDGTAQDVPFGTRVVGNMASEIGLYVKQSGFYYHAKSGQATVEGNIYFNMPRAGVNINDGYAGGHSIRSNLCFNAVRETSDHGCFNSWDREPYQWDPAAPLNLYPATTTIASNFHINNYHSTWPIDHDDGSNNYLDAGNFNAWGGAKDYLGFNKTFVGNFWLYPDADMPTAGAPALPRTGFSPYCYDSQGGAALPASARDSWTGETCLVASPGAIYDFGGCSPSSPANGYVPVLANNTILIDSGSYVLSCGGKQWSLAQAQAAGLDVGSTSGPAPPSAGALALATQFVHSQLMAGPPPAWGA